MNLIEKYGSWACVAGAGEGLGRAFAEGLARRGFNIILIDYKKDLLESLTNYLKTSYRINIESLCLDLNEKKSIEPIMDSLLKHKCHFLIYNASYGPVKPFLSNSTEEIDKYLNVNIGTQLHIIHQFADLFKDEYSGILMLSSLAGFRGTQFVVPYAATKAFIWNMAEGLHYELKDTNVDISVCCPGPTDTPNYKSSNPRKTLFGPKSRNPELVAEEALKKFGKKLFIIPGAANKFTHFILNHLLPRKIASTIHNAAMKKMYG